MLPPFVDFPVAVEGHVVMITGADHHHILNVAQKLLRVMATYHVAIFVGAERTAGVPPIDRIAPTQNLPIGFGNAGGGGPVG